MYHVPSWLEKIKKGAGGGLERSQATIPSSLRRVSSCPTSLYIFRSEECMARNDQYTGFPDFEVIDTLLLTVPNQLGVDYNAHVINAILTQIAPAMGWR